MTVIQFIQRNFFQHNRERSQLLFRMDDNSSTQGVRLLSRRLELLDAEEEESSCLDLRQSEVGFLAIGPFLKSIKIEGRKGVTVTVGRLHPCSSQDPPTETRYPPDRTSDPRLCRCLAHSKVLLQAYPSVLPGWAYLDLALDGCSKMLVFETTTSPKEPVETLENNLSFHGRYLLQAQ